MKTIIPFLFIFSLIASTPDVPYSDSHQIAIQNTVLAKINNNTISMMDVKKKMDLAFHQFYPQLAESNQARFQFYTTGWRRVLSDLIDQELILADAEDKNIKLTDGEVREEMENRFGPNVTETLEKIGLTYNETCQLIKNEMIVQRMSWWFIHQKAISKVTPQEIRNGYRLYLKENPSYTEWQYRVLTIRGNDSLQIAKDLYKKITEETFPIEKLSLFLKESPNSSQITLSKEFTTDDRTMIEAYRKGLEEAPIGGYSKPQETVSRDRSKVVRIFYLENKKEHITASFEEMSAKIKNELIQKATAEISAEYLGKLRKNYQFDEAHLKKMIPEQYQPFTIY